MMFPSPRNQRREINFLFLITVFGFSLRMYHLDFQSLWFDELCTFARINGGLAHTFETLSASPFPPLYYIVMNLWCKIFGYSELALRFPSLMFSTLSIPMIFYLSKSLVGAREGLISALLLSVSLYSINYAQEAKMYAMLWCLCIGAFLFFFLFVKTGQNKHLIWYVIFTLLSIYTLYTGFIFIIVQNSIYFTLYRKRIKAWLVAGFFILLCYTPWWYTAFYNIVNKSGIDWIGRTNPGWFLSRLFNAVVGIDIPISPILGVEHFVFLALMALAFVDLCLRLLKPSVPSKDHIALFMWPSISIAIFFFIDMFATNILVIRYLGFLHIPVIVLSAVGICFVSSISGISITTNSSTVVSRSLNLHAVAYGLIIFILTASFLFHVLPYHQNSLKRNGENWKRKISELCSEAGPNDAVFISASAKVGFDYYGNCFEGSKVFIPSDVLLTEELVKEKLDSSQKPEAVFILYRLYRKFLGPDPSWLQNYTITKNGARKVDFIRMKFE